MIVGPPMDKQSAEILDWVVRFKSELASGQRLVGVVFRAIKESDHSDATIDLKHTEPTILDDGTTGLVAQMVKAGVGTGAGTDYILELKVTDNIGRIFEAERRLRVRDIP
jgi:hypothetical protein